MKTYRPLLRGNFIFKDGIMADYEEMTDFLEWFDPVLEDKVFDIIAKFEVDRKVTLELWPEKYFKKISKSDPQIRPANLFEILAFASRFETAHIDYGEYYGFDSILGKVIPDHYFPSIYGEPGEPECVVLFLYNDELNYIPKLILVVTKEKLI